MQKDNVEILLEPIASSSLIDKDEAVVRVPNWRPWSLRLPFFIAAVTINSLHSALCAVLIWFSYSNSSVFEFSATSTASYMLWQFLPMTLAVFAGLVWEIPYISMCQMQPYQDLASPQGATLKDSLSRSYFTSFSLFLPYHAFRHPKKHTALAMMSITYLLSYGLLPTATTAMLKIHWDSDTAPTKGTAQPLIYMMILSLAVSVLASAFAVAAFIILHRRNSGVHADPASIAGLGALVAESNLLDKFRSLRSFESQAGIDKALGDYQLCLEYTSAHHHSYQISLLDPAQIVPEQPKTSIKREFNEAHPWWLRGSTYLGLSLSILIPEAIILAANSDSITSNAFYIKVCYAGIAVAGSALAANWHIHVAILQPFHALSAHGRISRQVVNGSANALKADFIGSAVSNLVPKQSYSVWCLAMYAFIVQLSVILGPALFQNQALMLAALRANVDPYDSETIVVVPDGVRILIKIYYGFSVISLVFPTIALIIIMKAKRKPFMPRKPNTLSSVILYLCHSNELLEDLKGMSTLSKKARDHRLIRNKHKYGFGWIWYEAKEYTYVGIDRSENIGAVFKYPKGTHFPLQDRLEKVNLDGSVEHPACWPQKVR